MDGVGDTPQTVTTTRAPMVLKTQQGYDEVGMLINIQIYILSLISTAGALVVVTV